MNDIYELNKQVNELLEWKEQAEKRIEELEEAVIDSGLLAWWGNVLMHSKDRKK